MKKITTIFGLVLVSLTVHATSLNDLSVDLSGEIDKGSKDTLACLALKSTPNIMAKVDEEKQTTLMNWFDTHCSSVSDGKSLNQIRSEFSY